MRASVQLENAVVEILDAETEAGDPELADHGQLVFGQRTRLALERNFLGLVPRRDGAQACDEPLKLLRRQERRRLSQRRLSQLRP